MTVNTPRFQGVCGEAGASAKLNDVSLKLLRTRGIASVASLQKEKSISNAERLLIVYAKLYSLRMNGARSGEIKPVSTANGVFVAEIDTAKLPDGPALYFELAK